MKMLPGDDVALAEPQREWVFAGLIAQVNGGDDEAAKRLLALCHLHPELWSRIVSLEQMATDSWLNLLAPGNAHQSVFNRTSILDELERRRASLQASGDSPLEQLLIGRILSAWLQVLYTETRYACVLSTAQTSASTRDHWQKAGERAQRQLLRAIQALAATRRLLKPTTVNIAQNQINLVGPT